MIYLLLVTTLNNTYFTYISLQKLWSIDDVLEERSSEYHHEVLVVWSNWSGPPEWINLLENKELQQYLEHNRNNPYTTTLAKSKLKIQNICNFGECDALRQVIFDKLCV